MSSRTSSPKRILVALTLASVIGIVATFLGLVNALADWQIKLLIISVLLPAILLLVDYRFGLALIVLLFPYSGSPLLPKAGPFSMINILIIGVSMSFLLRSVLSNMNGTKLPFPLKQELFWFYLVPIAFATMNGTFHLDEIPAHLSSADGADSYTVRQYWISFYFKSMLLVAAACILGAAAVEQRDALRFAKLTIWSGLLYVVLIVVVISATGASLDQLKNARGFLRPLGFHNNEAGYLLFWPFAAALFMREYVSSRVHRATLLAATLIIALGIILTFSRGAFIAMLTVAMVYVWRFRHIRVGMFVLMLAVVAFAIAPAAVRDRLSTGLDGQSIGGQLEAGGNDELTAGRVYLWRNLAPEIIRSPVIGRGLDSGRWSEFAKRGSVFVNPHNLYISILMDLGIIGAVLIFLFYRFVWRLFRRLSEDSRLEPALRGYFLGAVAAMLGMLVSGMAWGAYYPATFLLFFWTSIGLALGCDRYLANLTPDMVSPEARQVIAHGYWRPKT